MSVLYLTEQGSVVRKEGLVFAVIREREVLHKVPVEQVEQVVVFGNISLTTPVIQHLLRHGIDIVFCTVSGDYYGRLIGDDSTLGRQRLHQYAAWHDPTRRLELARAIIRGKLANQRTLLQRYRRARQDERLDTAVAALTQALERAAQAPDHPALMGLEGVAAAAYFGALRLLLKQDFGFERRARRPPPDPVNAMLGLGYMLLLSVAQHAVRLAGLDPFIGYLHAPASSRPSLALDLMEEFRPIIVDSIVVRMVNTGMVDARDFLHDADERGRRRVTLTQPLLKRFLTEFEKRMQTVVQYPALANHLSYRQIVEQQARQWARVVQEERRQYTPFEVK